MVIREPLEDAVNEASNTGKLLSEQLGGIHRETSSDRLGRGSLYRPPATLRVGRVTPILQRRGERGWRSAGACPPPGWPAQARGTRRPTMGPWGGGAAEGPWGGGAADGPHGRHPHGVGSPEPTAPRY